MATWPVAVFIGNSYKKTWTGVPTTPIQWYKHDFINVSPGVHARRLFRRYALGSSIAMGWLIAYNLVDNSGWRSDVWKNRPDLRPYPAMVKPDDDDDVTAQTAKANLYKKHNDYDMKQTSWYRFLFPLDANFNVKENPYRKVIHTEVFNPRKPQYQTYSNDRFSDHQA